MLDADEISPNNAMLILEQFDIVKRTLTFYIANL